MFLEPGCLGLGQRLEDHGEWRRLCKGGFDGVVPSRAGGWEGIIGRDVGLDVEDGGAIDEITGANPEMMTLDAQQCNRCQAQRIRAIRASGGKDAAALRRASRGKHEGTPPFVPMKPPDQPDPLEPLQIPQGQSWFHTLDQLKETLLGIGIRRLVTSLELHLLLGPDVSDGLEGEFGWHSAVMAELP